MPDDQDERQENKQSLQSRCKPGSASKEIGSFLLVGLFLVAVLTLGLIILDDQYTHYVVIVDAGEQSSNIRVYKYTTNENNDYVLILTSNYFKESKKGLSSYLSNVTEGVKSIEDLLEGARTFIPENKLSFTRLALRASPVIRMAAQAKAEQLMSELRKLFDKSGFKVDNKSVGYKEDSDEGIFRWITVNYLNNEMKLYLPKMHVAVINLDEGSTKITFPVTNSKEAALYEKEDVRKLTGASSNISLFTHNYPDSGFQAARHAILTNGNTTQGNILQSVCLSPSTVNATWTYQNVNYTVGGLQNDKNVTGVDIKACAELINRNIPWKITWKPNKLTKHQLTGCYKFFSTTFDMGEGIEFNVEQIIKKTVEICAKFNKDQDPFHCLDLIYTWKLFTDGFGLSNSTKLAYKHEIHEQYVSWTLGYALTLIGYVRVV